MANKKLKFDNPLEGSALFTTPEEQAAEVKKVGRPRKKDIIREEEGNTAQAGLTEDYTRATLIMRVESLNKLKDYAYTERLTIKDALDQIITKFFDEYDGELLEHKK